MAQGSSIRHSMLLPFDLGTHVTCIMQAVDRGSLDLESCGMGKEQHKH